LQGFRLRDEETLRPAAGARKRRRTSSHDVGTRRGAQSRLQARPSRYSSLDETSPRSLPILRLH
jgi:hypothetical protein